MKIRIADAELMSDLLGYLGTRSDLVVAPLSDCELETTVLGSYGEDALRMELELLLRAWQAAHPGTKVELVEVR